MCFIFLLGRDLHLNSLSVTELYLKSKFPDSTSPLKQILKKNLKKPEEHLTKYWNQTLWFSFLPVLLPWKEYIWSDLMSRRCVPPPPNYWTLSRASFLQPCMLSEFKCFPCLEGNFMVKHQIVLNSFWEDRLLSKSVSVLTSIFYHKHTYPRNSWDVSFFPQCADKGVGLPSTVKSKKIRY